MIELCLVLEEIGRAVAPVPYWATLALGALPIAEFGDAAQKAAFLPGVIAGEIVLSGAFEEADGDDPARPATKAVRDGAAWRLSGTKICVPAAHIAARVLVPASVGGGRVGLFLVDPKGAGREARDAARDEPRARRDDAALARAGQGRRRARHARARQGDARAGSASARSRVCARCRSASPIARCA